MHLLVFAASICHLRHLPTAVAPWLFGLMLKELILQFSTSVIQNHGDGRTKGAC